MDPLLRTVPRGLLSSVLALLLLVLGAWALQRNLEWRRMEHLAMVDRTNREGALIVQGRLAGVLGSAQFAAGRLMSERGGVGGKCKDLMTDLVGSHAVVLGGAVYDDLGRTLCTAGLAPAAPAVPVAQDSWRMGAQAGRGLRMDLHRSTPPTPGGLYVSLRLDATALMAGLGRDADSAADVAWVSAIAAALAGGPSDDKRLGGPVVPRVLPGASPAVDLAALNMRAVGAVLLACMATAMALLWLNRRRLRGDSERLMHIARHPQEGDRLRPRMHDNDLAVVAHVVATEQRQLRALSDQLMQARDRLEEVQRAASMGSWRLDLTKDCIDWSHQACEIFGQPSGDGFGVEHVLSLVHPEDRPLLAEKHRALVADQSDLDMVYRIERPGGEERVVHARGTVAARDQDGRPVTLVGTVQDVTAAWEVSSLSDALARALALSRDPVLMTREHAGIWLWAWSNRAWDRLCEQLQIDGREADHQLFNPEVGLLRSHAERVREAHVQGKVLRLDLELASAQGSRWFDAELIPQVNAPGRTGHGLLLLRDRTVERQGAQALRDANVHLERVVGERTAALARSEQKYRVLADLSPQILWQADEEGRVNYLNRAWHDLVGPRDGGWLGLGWIDALHPDDVAAARSAISEGRHTGQPWQARRRVKCRAGGYRSFLGVAAPVLGSEGAVEGWVGVEADITELEQHAGRLQQLNAELETFSYTVSHDLRAPVHVIKGFVEALLAGQVGQIDDQARGYLDRVLRSARRMDELIADLLSLARLSRETLQLSRFDAIALANDLVEVIQERYPGRQIEFHCRVGTLTIEADRRLFRVLLENLLDNAAKFTAGQPVARIELGWQIEHADTVLILADNGVGFPSEFAHRLFRPYQRLHSQAAFPGHGIGLATVARIVQLHGGSISAQGQPDGGAAFRIRLPQRAQGIQASDTVEPAHRVMETQ